MSVAYYERQKVSTVLRLYFADNSRSRYRVVASIQRMNARRECRVWILVRIRVWKVQVSAGTMRRDVPTLSSPPLRLPSAHCAAVSRAPLEKISRFLRSIFSRSIFRLYDCRSCRIYFFFSFFFSRYYCTKTTTSNQTFIYDWNDLIMSHKCVYKKGLTFGRKCVTCVSTLREKMIETITTERYSVNAIHTFCTVYTNFQPVSSNPLLHIFMYIFYKMISHCVGHLRIAVMYEI